MSPDETNPPGPVNAFSSMVDPRRLFPMHFDALMRDMYSQGQQPERWRVLDAVETQLDQHGQEVEFTLVQYNAQRSEELIWRRRVLASHGKVVRILAV
ncbi:MAG: hypothetical protein AAB263_01385 [Planctomycetota bacterium]